MLRNDRPERGCKGAGEDSNRQCIKESDNVDNLVEEFDVIKITTIVCPFFMPQVSTYRKHL